MTKKDKAGKKKNPVTEKGPSLKEIFEIKVQDLGEQLSSLSKELATLRAEEQEIRGCYAAESKELCVDHLKGVLQKESEKFDEADECRLILQAQAELTEQREQEKRSTAERNHQTTLGSIQQLKHELGEKLSLLDLRRQERDSLLKRSRELRAALSSKITNAERRDRDEDVTRVDQLLRCFEELPREFEEAKRGWKAFLHMEMSHRDMEVDNAKLQQSFRDAGQALLHTLERNRLLRDCQKSLGVELEMQSLMQCCASDRISLQKKCFKSFTEAPLKEEKSPTSPGSDCRLNRIRPLEWIEMCRFSLRDFDSDVESVREDQRQYRKSVKRKIEEQRDRNGQLMSMLLRAGKIFVGRHTKDIILYKTSNVNTEMLTQIKMLLNLSDA